MNDSKQNSLNAARSASRFVSGFLSHVILGIRKSEGVVKEQNPANARDTRQLLWKHSCGHNSSRPR